MTAQPPFPAAPRSAARALAAAAALLTGFAAAASAGLTIVNGDFSDLAGLTQGQDRWYAGVPKGWCGAGGAYAVHAARGATPPTCNPSTLGLLRQNAGMLDRASDVTLRFDVSEPWKPDAARPWPWSGRRAAARAPS